MCVCTDSSVFSLFLSGKGSHSLAQSSGGGTEPSHGGVSDSVARRSHFPPRCDPRWATLLQQ